MYFERRILKNFRSYIIIGFRELFSSLKKLFTSKKFATIEVEFIRFMKSTNEINNNSMEKLVRKIK